MQNEFSDQPKLTIRTSPEREPIRRPQKGRGLVLSRKLEESVQIGDAVVTVTRIGAKCVRLAIEAPPHVAIVRTELLEEGIETRPCDVNQVA